MTTRVQVGDLEFILETVTVRTRVSRLNHPDYPPGWWHIELDFDGPEELFPQFGPVDPGEPDALTFNGTPLTFNGTPLTFTAA